MTKKKKIIRQKNYTVSLTEVATDKAVEILRFAGRSGLLNGLLMEWLKKEGWRYDKDTNTMIEIKQEDQG